MKGQDQYVLNGKRVFRSGGYFGADCDIVGTRHEQDSADTVVIHCPNCGNTAPGKKLVSGCPFCGTAFTMEELNDRVCNYSLFRDPFFNRARAGLKLNGHLNRFSFLIALVFTVVYATMLKDTFIRSGSNPLVLPFGILVFSFSNLLIFLLLLGAFYLLSVPLRLLLNAVYRSAQERRNEELKVFRRNQDRLPSIRRIDPEFSLQSFLTNVRNKAASVHYAGSAAELEVFSSADLSEHIAAYRNVFDCRFGPVEIEDYRAAGKWREADVSVSLKLFRLEGGRVHTEPEKIRMTLKRMTGLPEKNPFGIHSLRCGSCGHPLDLMEGNTCAFCGCKWDLSRYDWCVQSYLSQAGSSAK